MIRYDRPVDGPRWVAMMPARFEPRLAAHCTAHAARLQCPPCPIHPLTERF